MSSNKLDVKITERGENEYEDSLLIDVHVVVDCGFGVR